MASVWHGRSKRATNQRQFSSDFNTLRAKLAGLAGAEALASSVQSKSGGQADKLATRYYDSELGRWISEGDMRPEWYRRIQLRRHFYAFRYPFFWLLHATELHMSASLLNEAMRSKREVQFGKIKVQAVTSPKIALMLGGMAMENILKAGMLARFTLPLTDASLRDVAKGSHDLVKDAARAHVRTNKRDREVLAMLSEHVRWAGRYPLPKTVDQLDRARTVPTSDWEDYVPTYEKLLRLIERRLYRWHHRGGSP